jgi:isoaspartyl peptidase/L-asparaginase-like protein (Ntn-hydrolase superfamily)
MSEPAIAVHGGAGVWPAERHAAARAGAARAVAAGFAVLAAGGPALDAVQAAVVVLEDDPTFNAGHGAALTEEGGVELDAAIMRGGDRAAGAVAALRGIRHPVLAARAVLEEGRHVLLAGEAAAAWARAAGVPEATEAWLATPAQDRAATGGGAGEGSAGAAQDRAASGGGAGEGSAGPVEDRAASGGGAGEGSAGPVQDRAANRGTVGAVARDVRGGLAAATSTGGITGQRPGRVGDSPLVAAGTWADDGTAAVSCTGTGEAIIRAALAHEVDALIRHGGRDLAQAAAEAVAELLRYEGDGGLIAVGPAGGVVAEFNSPGMARGWRVGDGPVLTGVFRDDDG